MARFASQAEYYRHHGRCMKLAIERGCTPKEVECEIERQEARERWAVTEQKLRAKQAICETRAPDLRAGHDDSEKRRLPWYESED